MKNHLIGQFVVLFLLGLCGCMEFGKSGVPKPTRPEPLTGEPEEAAAPAPAATRGACGNTTRGSGWAERRRNRRQIPDGL